MKTRLQKIEAGSLFLIELFSLLMIPVSSSVLINATIIFLVSVYRFLKKLGNGSFLLELIYIHATLTCILMPVMGYLFYTKDVYLARIWARYMPVSEMTYFGFILPALVLYGWAFFLFRTKSDDYGETVAKMNDRIKEMVQIIPVRNIVALAMLSLVAYSASSILPQFLAQVSAFIYFSFFTSVFYVLYYKNFPYKKLFIAAAIGFITLDSLRSSMFTIIAYMGGIFAILLLAGKKIPFIYRLIVMVVGLTFLVTIQVVKMDIRSRGKNGGNIFLSMYKENNYDKLNQAFFPIYYRMNQGYNVSMVQRRIPDRVDFLGGEYLMKTFASAFVPRLLWPDKPEAGGKFNMEYYTGNIINGYSTNIGPVGEAYGSFGPIGGCIYMLFFGLFIRFFYTGFLKACQRIPLLFLWMPVLFYQVVFVMETDSLQVFNSLLKGVFFIYVFSKIFPVYFPKLKT